MTADRIRVWLSVALLGLVMLGGFWIYEVMRRNTEDQASNGRVRTESDYFVEHFNFVRLSQSGNTNYRVTGQKLTHFPQEDEFEIVQPRIIGIDQEKTPMNIRADRAIVKQKVQEKVGGPIEDQIHLLDNVEVVRAASALGVEVQLKTNKLVLFPDSERMRTDDAIELKTPNALITAIGMEADNAHQSVRFLHQLRATINKKAQTQ